MGRLLEQIRQFIHEQDDVLLDDDFGQGIKGLLECREANGLRSFVAGYSGIHQCGILLFGAVDEGETDVFLALTEPIHQGGLPYPSSTVHGAGLSGSAGPYAFEHLQLFSPSYEHDR